MSDYSLIENMIVPYLTLSGLLFVIGLCGILANARNVISILMSIELMLLAVNINLVVFSCYTNNIVGQIFSIFILTVAAAEAAVGLAVILQLFKKEGAISIDSASEMKG